MFAFSFRRRFALPGAICVLAVTTTSWTADYPANYVAGSLIRLNDNGAWSWFMDPRVIVDDGKLIVGSVRSIGNERANVSDPNWGNVEVSVYALATGKVNTTVLHPHLEQDDHDGPSFLVRPDGRYVALYSKHAVERRMYWRISEPHDPLAWGPATAIETPGTDQRAFAGDNFTYTNPFRLPDGRTINFFRGPGHEPNYMISNDDGTTWTYGGHMFYGKGGYSPYLKYASDGKGTIHFVATEDHPRNFDNSLYHGFLRDGVIHHSDGRVLGPLSTTAEAKFATWDLTKVFQGDPDNVAWMCDIRLDRDDRPYVLFSVQKDGRGLPRGQGGMDLRYHYARWDGKTWATQEIAYAGRRLYPTEDDYTGLGALDPNNPDIVYISTDADPVTGAPLVSDADHKRHYELFRGRRQSASRAASNEPRATSNESRATSNERRVWTWTPMTRNSTADNLRPLVPRWSDPRTALVWMRGSYVHNHGEWYTAVVALILPPSAP